MILALILFFIFGTAIGSFLNVVAYRSVHGGSILFDSSKCVRCKKKLQPVDLVPIVSFLILKGRCRSCHKKISHQYPLVEAATGVAFAFSFYYWIANVQGVNFLDILSLAYLLFTVSVLIVLFTTDLVDGLLPNSVVLPSILLVAVYRLVLLEYGLISVSTFTADIMATFIISFIFFAIVYLSKEKALGGGDVKLVFLISLAVGWPAVILALFVAFLTGGLAAAMLILLGKKRLGQTVPLGPFLSIGALSALFWGQQVVSLYLRSFL